MAGAAGGVIVAVVLVRRWLPQAPVLRHVFLQPPAGEEARTISRREMLVDLENLLGTRGRHHHPAYSGRQGPFRQRPGRRGGRGRTGSPRHRR